METVDNPWIEAGVRLLLKRGIYEWGKKSRIGIDLDYLSTEMLFEIARLNCKTEVEKEVAFWRRAAAVKKMSSMQEVDEKAAAISDLMEAQGWKTLDTLWRQ